MRRLDEPCVGLPASFAPLSSSPSGGYAVPGAGGAATTSSAAAAAAACASAAPPPSLPKPPGEYIAKARGDVYMICMYVCIIYVI